MLALPKDWSTAVARPMHHGDWLVERAYLGESRRPAAEELAHLWHMVSWRDRLLYAYGHLQMHSGPGSGGLRSRIRYLWSRLRQRTR